MKIKQRKRTAVIKNLRGAYISDQKTKSVYFKLRPLPPRWLRHCRILFKHFLLLGSEGGAWHSAPLHTLMAVTVHRYLHEVQLS